MASKEEKHVGVWLPYDGGKERFVAIFFPEKVEKLDLQPTATGVNLKIPSEIEVRCGRGSRGRPMATSLRATISLNSPSAGLIEVGVARDENYYIAEAKERTLEAEFVWRDALAGLIFIEKHRGDGRPVLRIDLDGELCSVVKCKEWWPNEPGTYRSGETYAEARTRPLQRIGKYGDPSHVEVSYPGEVWAKMIQEAFEASRDNPLLALQSLLPFLTGS